MLRSTFRTLGLGRISRLGKPFAARRRVAVYWGRRAADRHAERVEAERRRLAGLVARADQQQEWIMGGDEPGVYSEYSSAPI
jgi:hypothetical protein